MRHIYWNHKSATNYEHSRRITHFLATLIFTPIWPHKNNRTTICPKASGSRVPHQLISKFLFIASLEVFKEPPKKAAYKVLRAGPPRGRGRGGSLPQDLRLQGASSTNIKIFVIASLDVFKEHPNRSSL